MHLQGQWIDPKTAGVTVLSLGFFHLSEDLINHIDRSETCGRGIVFSDHQAGSNVNTLRGLTVGGYYSDRCAQNEIFKTKLWQPSLLVHLDVRSKHFPDACRLEIPSFQPLES